MAFPLADKLRLPVEEVAPHLGLPAQRWYWVLCAQIMLQAEAKYREGMEARGK